LAKIRARTARGQTENETQETEPETGHEDETADTDDESKKCKCYKIGIIKRRL